MPYSIANTLYNDIIRPRKTLLLTIVIIVIFAIAAYYAYKWYAKPAVDNHKIQNMSNMNTRNSPVEIYLFYADWCPHCTKAKPEWTTFKKSYDGTEVNGYIIKCIDVNCTEEGGESSRLIQKYSIDSYPTLIMNKNGDRIDFDSKITNDTLIQFTQTVLQK
jgi:thiol-disulfide isomerase/thioredoxin